MKPITLLCLVLVVMFTAVGCERKLTKSPKPRHDIAITKISVLSRGHRDHTVPVVVNIENQGDCGESFDVKLIDVTDGKEIGRKSVTLPAPGKAGIDGVCDLILNGKDGGTQRFGVTVAVGDVNGDGYDDLLVAAPRYNEWQGRAYLYYGGENMDDKADKIFTGENIGDGFSKGGGPSAYLADMNKDGFDDVIVGAREFNNSRGRVYIFYGGLNMDENPDIIIEGEDPNSALGHSIAVGDVNGDGDMDLIVGATHFDSYRGRAYLYYGPIASDTTVDKIFTGESTNNVFAFVMTARGDVDGDGCSDLLIGTQFWPNYKDINRGRAYLYYGGPGATMDETCDLYFDAENPNDQFAAAVDLFDIDNDGRADVLISARRWPLGNMQGRGYLYWGSSRATMDNNADLHFESERPAKAGFGGNTILAGYINNDKYGDIILTAYDYYQFSQHGRTYLFYGNTKSSMDNACDHTFTGEAIGSCIQYARIANINGNKYGNVITSGWAYPNKTEEGRVWLYFGSRSSSTDITFYWDTTLANIGEHTLKAIASPILGEKDIADNTIIKMINLKDRP
jgi:hypothetical protein